jgi:predicted RNA methylase
MSVQATKPATPMMDWIDTKHHSAKLFVTKLPSGETAMVISGLTSSMNEWSTAQEAGYSVSRSGKYLMRPLKVGEKLSMPTIRLIFPRAVPIKMAQNQVFMRAKAEDETKSASSDMRDVAPVGFNYLGQDVFEGETGRFVKDNEGRAIRENSSVVDPAVFLHATDEKNLALCADGFVLRMVNGEVLRSNDLRRFAAVVSGESGFMRIDDTRLRHIQEAVEAALQRKQHSMPGVDENAFTFAVKLNENQPSLNFRSSTSVINQQYSTPLPMSILAQMLLGPMDEKSVLEPTIGNGSLVMSLPESAKIYGFEIDPKRVAQVNQLRANMQVIEGNTLYNKAPLQVDAVIANPPFGGLDKVITVDKLQVHRLDYQIVLHALSQRIDEGRGIFIVGADNENKYEKNAGEIHGSSRTFFKWLSDHYEVEDITEFDGRLYAKQGAEFPTRMISIGRRRNVEDIAERFKKPEIQIGDMTFHINDKTIAEKLPVVRTWSEAWNHMVGVLNVMNEKDDMGAGGDIPEIDLFGGEESDLINPVPGGDAEIVDETKKEEFKINEFQAPYISQSKTGEASTMVPRNLEAPIAQALENFNFRTGLSTDDFVKDKLQVGNEELKAYSPEQIDAIALAIHRFEGGRGFILGDQTGIGKGRTLAGIARYAALIGKPVVFMTKKPNLFTDFWRDVEDINSTDLFTPLIMNADTPVLDQNNEVAIKPTPRNEFKRVVNGSDPMTTQGYNLLFATYSQVNRLGTEKSAFLRRVCGEDTLLILDESHEAAGASNVGFNIADAVNESSSTIYSSATYCKGAKNMQVYAKAFPESVTMDKLADVLEIGGEPLQEVLSAQLAADGALIRREHDLSDLEFNVLIDEKNVERNEALADKVSEILRGMSYLSGDVSKTMVDRLQVSIKNSMETLSTEQRKGSRMGVNYVNFGSRLYNLQRQFALAIKTDFVADEAIKAIREGRKPVIALEQTNEQILMESLYNVEGDTLIEEPGEDALFAEVSAAQAATKKANTENSVENLMKGVKEIPIIDFRHVLKRMLGRLSSIKTTDFYGNVTEEFATTIIPPGMDSDAAAVFHENYKENEDRISALIDALPSLPLSPIDAIAQKIEEAGTKGSGAESGGFSVSEVSGRKLSVRISVDNSMLVLPRPDRRLEAIYNFNNGQADAMVLTKAGSTGMSAHASERFADQRQRHFFELQIAEDVNDRVQFFGRVNRKGQVCSPRITSVSSGLPFELRPLAMQNRKLRRLSANTQSNRRNSAEIVDVPDLLNGFGNKVCKEFLENNPEIASILDIELDSELETEGRNQDECYFANKLFGRIALLSVLDQKRVIKDVTDEFERQLKELDEQGINPLKSRELDIKGKIVHSEIMVGVEKERYDSVFDHPVYLSIIEWKEERDPIRYATVQAYVNSGIASFAVRGLKKEKIYSWAEPTLNVKPFMNVVNKTIDRAKAAALPIAFKTVEEAMGSEKDNIVKKLDERKEFLNTALTRTCPGNLIEWSTKLDGNKRGVVVDVEFPPEGQEHNLGKYVALVAIPGQDKCDRVSFYHLHSDASFAQVTELYGYKEAQTKDAFDSAPKGFMTRSTNALTGNLFRAAEIASQKNLGSAVVYTDEEGRRQRGVFVKSSVKIEDIKNFPIDLPDARCAYEYLKFLVSESDNGSALIRTDEPAEHTLLGRKDLTTTIAFDQRLGIVKITVPGTKTSGGRYFENKDLLNLVKGGEFSGNRDRMSATTSTDNLEEVVKQMSKLGAKFVAAASHRDRANEIVFGASNEQHSVEKLAA